MTLEPGEVRVYAKPLTKLPTEDGAMATVTSKERRVGVGARPAGLAGALKSRSIVIQNVQPRSMAVAGRSSERLAMN